MKHGKHICETLKAIRSEIASANEIDYTPIKCTHKGDCAGTCPACESETRWLERQLSLRQALGKAVTIAGVSVALTMAASAATPSTLDQSNKKDKHLQRANHEAQTDGYIQVQKQQLVTRDTTFNVEDDRQEARTMGMVPRFIPHPDSIYTEVDVEAFYPGGEEALDSIIRNQLYIPDEILEPIKEIRGTIKARCIVKVLVERDGTVSDAVIEKTTTAAIFDDEALRVAKNLPLLTPASIMNMPVRSWKLIPVEFVYDFSKEETKN